jgi:HD-GYP domain-containing protein (c-di-GMP phosphodiesterase class II)
MLTGGGHDASLLDSYDRQHADGREEDSVRDGVTGLPGDAALRQRLEEYAADGEVPRIALLRVLHLDEAARRLAPAASALLRRRLATRYRELARAADAELYAVSPVDFALLSEHLTPHATEALGRTLARATETFAPLGHRTLALAIGHAGSEAAREVGPLRELAERALVVASAAQRSGVVGADVLALGTSSTTELEAAQRLLAFVEQHDGHPPGHGERVATVATALARELGFEGLARSQVRLAAHLHAIGKVGLPLEAMAGPAGLTGDALWSYRSHPLRGESYLRLSGGAEVAQTVRSHREHYDGTGFPDGLAGDQIPLAARVVAVADRFDALRRGGPGTPALPLDAALAALREETGGRLDPEVVGLAVGLLPRTESV